MTKKHLLFALIVCMSTVWRFLELLEYGEIEVRQVDTYMYFYMLATCFVLLRIFPRRQRECDCQKSERAETAARVCV